MGTILKIAPMLRLATILDKKINVIKELPDEESNLIKLHFDRIYWLRKILLLPNQIIAIYDEIKKDIETNETEKLQRLISELFTNFRSFLDYWETNLKREFGKTSKQFQAFKDATHLEYDNIFAYRFMYELRNYIQHCGMPDFIVKKKLDENENKIISLNLYPQKLLKSFDWKPKVKNDLMTIKHELDFMIVISILLKSIERINNIALSQYDIKPVIESCDFVLQFENYRIDESTLALINFPPDYPSNISGDMSVVSFPFDIARHFKESITINE